jgi:Ca2+-binding EF-hand superfamily protein
MCVPIDGVVLLRKVGLRELEKRDVEALVPKFDVREDGHVDYVSFVRWLDAGADAYAAELAAHHGLRLLPRGRRDADKVFEGYDRHGRGSIAARDLPRALDKLGLVLTDVQKRLLGEVRT